ncbi:MAG: ABC transporter permease [Thermoplasmata archaeon]|nr:ABC transporter permease [Thermoplasmata archaeon]
MTYRGTFLGGRFWISTLLAALPPILLGAFVADGVSGARLISAFGAIVATLVLSVEVPLITLIIGVGLFRTEIEEDTLPFLTLRTVARPIIVLGKYLGGWAAALTFLLPSLGLSLALMLAGADGVAVPAGYLSAVGALVFLGSVAYLAVYLLIGLVTRTAIVVGLVYAFLWEFILPLFPGHLPQITVYYYLRTVAALLTSAAPFGGYSSSAGLGVAVAVPVVVAIVTLLLASVVFRFVETAPGRTET